MVERFAFLLKTRQEIRISCMHIAHWPIRMYTTNSQSQGRTIEVRQSVLGETSFELEIELLYAGDLMVLRQTPKS